MRRFFPCFLFALFTAGVCPAQDANTSAGPQYLVTSGSQLFARSISTPSMSISGPTLQVGAENATGGGVAGAQDQIVPPSQPDAPPHVDLFPIYYGEAWAGPIKISSLPAPTAAPTPAVVQEPGVSHFTTAPALRERGYGITIAEAAARSREHSGHATRIYTNADIDRLRGGE